MTNRLSEGRKSQAMMADHRDQDKAARVHRGAIFPHQARKMKIAQTGSLIESTKKQRQITFRVAKQETYSSSRPQLNCIAELARRFSRLLPMYNFLLIRE